VGGHAHIYARNILGVESPRVGLLSIGEEAGKGNDLVRETFKLLKESGLNFIGTLKGNDIFNGNADVIVCDGFTGNVSLKVIESATETLFHFLKQEFSRSWRTRLGYFLSRRRSRASRSALITRVRRRAAAGRAGRHHHQPRASSPGDPERDPVAGEVVDHRVNQQIQDEIRRGAHGLQSVTA